MFLESGTFLRPVFQRCTHTALDCISSFIWPGLYSDAVPNERGCLCILPLYYTTRLLASLSLLSSPLTLNSYTPLPTVMLICFLWPASCNNCKLQNQAVSESYSWLKIPSALFSWRWNDDINLTVNMYTLATPSTMDKRKKAQALTGERAWSGGIDTVTAIPTLTAGDLIIRLPQGRARGGGSFHLLKFPLQYSTHGPPHLHLKPKDSRGATHYLIFSLGPS